MSSVFIAFGSYIVLNAVAISLLAKACRNVRRPGKHRALHVLFKGGSAQRDEFTEIGWALRNLAIAVHTHAFVVGALLLIFL